MNEKLTPSPANLCSRYAEKMISVKITSKCNGRCAFCIDNGGYKFDERNMDVFELAKVIRNLDDFQTVIITGGEPSLELDRTLDLIRLIRLYKKRIVLNTNGTLFNVCDDPVGTLDHLIDELQISIHTPDETANRETFRLDPCPILKSVASFDRIRAQLHRHPVPHHFTTSVNCCFTNAAMDYEKRRPNGKPFVQAMIDLCKYLGANRLRLTELKRVPDAQYVRADDFEIPWLMPKTDEELITRGCTDFAKVGNVTVSVKRVCKYARGTDAKAFSCCFVDRDGQDKIEGIEHVDSTFRVVYGDGTVTTDWIF